MPAKVAPTDSYVYVGRSLLKAFVDGGHVSSSREHVVMVREMGSMGMVFPAEMTVLDNFVKQQWQQGDGAWEAGGLGIVIVVPIVFDNWYSKINEDPRPSTGARGDGAV